MSSDPKGTDNLQAEIAREYKEFKSSGEVMRLDDEPDELTTLRAQLQELEAKVPKWVSVEGCSRIPEGIRVMFWHKSWGTSIDYWRGHGRTTIGLCGDSPSHWMPLPTPPEDSTPKTGFQQALEKAESEMTVVMGAGERWKAAQQESQND